MNDRRPSSLYVGVCLTAGSAILFEIALTKVFSVTMWYHFAYLAVSLALFGLGAGGLGAFFGQKYLDRQFPAVLKHLSSLQAASLILAIMTVLGIPCGDIPSLAGILKLVIIFLVCAVPFFLVGMCLSLAIRHYAEQVSRIYFADLVGSAVACFLFYVAISLFSGPAVVLIAALMSFAASIFFVEGGGSREIRTRAVVLIVATLALFALDTCSDVFRVRYTKTYKERDDVLFEKWSPLARITVYPTLFFRGNPDNPFGWGLSRKYRPDRPLRQLWIEQDACAGTPITRFTGDFGELRHLAYDVTSFVYHVLPGAQDAFIIGSGGGRDVLSALAFGVPRIKACDINPVIVDLVKRRYKDFAGNVYGLPNVDVQVAEGRSFLRRQAGRFDVIQISLIDSWAATLAGAFSLAENNLYTVEAFQGYLERLKDRGLLSVTRYLFQPRSQALRLAILARKALETRGVERPGDAIAVVATGRGTGMATVLVGRRAFTEQDILRMRQKADAIGFEVLYVPGALDADPDFREALTTDSLDLFLAGRYYDLRPPTDNRPFFFQMLYFSRALDLVFNRASIVGQVFNYFAPVVLISLLVISAVLVGLFFFVPLLLARQVTRLPWRFGLFFCCLGLGFMFVEIFLIQKGSLYLEHPTFSLTAVLFSMLTAAGVGSLWSGRITTVQLPARLRLFGMLTVLLLVGLGLVLEWLTANTIALPLAAKFPIFVSLVSVVAFLMGTLFPSGIRLISARQKDSIPWVWALNGGASVMGSILAMTVAMAFGYVQTLLVGCGCYLVATVIAWGLEGKRGHH